MRYPLLVLAAARLLLLLLLCCCRCCCCAAAAVSTTTAIAFLRLVTFRTGMNVLLLVLRLQPARDSRHTLYALVRVVARGTAW